eukprot:9008006-Alexandrium_andersonii.AAC.1
MFRLLFLLTFATRFAHSGFCLASHAVGVLAPLPWAPSARGLCEDSMRAKWGFSKGFMGSEQGLHGDVSTFFRDCTGTD